MPALPKSGTFCSRQTVGSSGSNRVLLEWMHCTKNLGSDVPFSLTLLIFEERGSSGLPVRPWVMSLSLAGCLFVWSPTRDRRQLSTGLQATSELHCLEIFMHLYSSQWCVIAVLELGRIACWPVKSPWCVFGSGLEDWSVCLLYTCVFVLGTAAGICDGLQW